MKQSEDDPWLRRLGSAATSPRSMRRINGWLTIAWILMVPISYAFGWLSSVTYVSALSLWAIVTGHWSAWQAARVELRQDVDANVTEVMDELGNVHERMDRLQRTMDAPGGREVADDAADDGTARGEHRRSGGDGPTRS